MKFASILTFAATTASVCASVFPTEPIAATKWKAGGEHTLKWVDDGKAPLVTEMGPMTINLMTGPNEKPVLIKTLATKVSAKAGKQKVKIPADVQGEAGPSFFLKITADLKDYYTTRFEITGAKVEAPKKDDGNTPKGDADKPAEKEKDNDKPGNKADAKASGSSPAASSPTSAPSTSGAAPASSTGFLAWTVAAVVAAVTLAC